MTKLNPIIYTIMGVTIILSSCYQDEPVYYDQLDVTLTRYDAGFDFSTYNTFAMADSVILRTNYLTDAQITAFYAPNGPAARTKEILRQNFLDLGYTQVQNASTADFISTCNVLKVRSYGSTYYPPGWWWGYPGYGWDYPGYGWAYPAYPWNPGYVSYYSYKEGGIILSMIDGESFRDMKSWQANPTDEPPEFMIRWMASIDGYLSGDENYNNERTEKGIGEAFEQSPYLRK